MKKIFDKKINYNKISFSYTNSDVFEERKIHTYHEILYFIDGDVSFFTESFQQKLERGTLIVIPKEKYHLFQCENDFIRLKISFSDSLEISSLLSEVIDIKVIGPLDISLISLLEKIISKLSLESLDYKDKTCIYGAFLMLLSEITVASNAKHGVSREKDHIITKCIKFIDDNIDKKLTLRQMSKKIGVSPSTLSHVFKQDIGISIHKYISEKRLTLARRLIEQDKNPTKIFLECGYSDYSSFYKAYLKMFGSPPSKHIEK